MLASSMGHTGTGWLDLLMDEGQSLHGNGPERPLSEGGGKTSTDSSPENPPSAQPLISNQISLSQPSNCSSAVEVTQTLLRLQRELLEFRRASRTAHLVDLVVLHQMTNQAPLGKIRPTPLMRFSSQAKYC